MNRNELRRLEKAAREKDKRYLNEWANQFEAQISEYYRREYEKTYKEELQQSIDNFITAIAYTLHFNEDTQFGSDKLPGFLEDLYVTINMYRTGEYKPEEYQKELEEAGLKINNYDYSALYKEKNEKLDNLIKEYDNKIKQLDNKLNSL